MSGQAKRSRVRALERWRRQAARLAVEAYWVGLRPGSVASQDRAERLLSGASILGTFDVAEVRAHCKRIVAEAAKAKPWDREILLDWRAHHGLTSRTMSVAQNYGDLEVTRKVRCDPPGLPPDMVPPSTIALARTAQRLLDTLDGRCPWAPSAEAQPSKCQTCEGSSLSRVGRVIDAIESDAIDVHTGHSALARMPPVASREFTITKRAPEPVVRVHHWLDDVTIKVEGLDDLRACQTCRGTGHNLQGRLPDVEWPAVVRRKAADCYAAGQTRRIDSWVDRTFPDGVDYGPMLASGETWTVCNGRLRVVPRGEHRIADQDERPGAITFADVNSHGYEVGDTVRVHGYGEVMHDQHRAVSGVVDGGTWWALLAE